jgi:hypothetical protein
MANEEMTAVDPLGKTIFLLPEACTIENEPYEIYDDATTVIQKPALLVEVNEDNATIFYYYRSVGWNSTLLISVGWDNNRWEVMSCRRNPSSEELSGILKKGKQII